MIRHATRRHLLVVASQCRAMPALTALEAAARDLHAVLRDETIGACTAALPDEVSMLQGELSRDEIDASIRAAVQRAAEAGATLVLALLGHGFTPGNASSVYFMAGDSREDDILSAVDIEHLLTAAADTIGVQGVI